MRIHTAIHKPDEAVELAKYIKTLVPSAHIFGTSTSGVIMSGKMSPNLCVISVTQMEEGHVDTMMIPAFDEGGVPIKANELCRQLKEAAVTDETKLLLVFLTNTYSDVFSLVELSNTEFPGIPMTGGIANVVDISNPMGTGLGFVFNENGWSDTSLMVATFSGHDLSIYSTYSTGVQVLGEEVEITDSFDTCILEIDGKAADTEYMIGVDDELRKRPELTNLFPYVYAEFPDIPVMMLYHRDESLEDIYNKDLPLYKEAYDMHVGLDTKLKKEYLVATHRINRGRKLKRALIYDRKIIEDNKAMFRRLENFDKSETLFAYTCVARSAIYSNCVKWELSPYENCNMCGCVVAGEIANSNGKNVFANCSFVVTAIGESEASQEYNAYTFSHTTQLAADNQELLNYLMEIETQLEENKRSTAAEKLKAFVRDCEMKLLYSENEDIPNAAAMNMDIKFKGYDRICIINVLDISGIKTIFSEQLVKLTYKNFISKCETFAKEKNYKIYMLSEGELAIGSPSYMVSLKDFVRDMEVLQKELFNSSDEYIAIVPVFCIIDDCEVESLNSVYYSARVEMLNKNVQFYVHDAGADQLDENMLRERYHIVNVINYAIANDKVIPYFQGIHDNKNNCIHHYEALMRLEDETGRVYYPNSFLDVARSYGLLYDSLSRIMIKKVFDRFKDCKDKSVSINLGMRDIKNKETSDQICALLSTAKYPHNFIFEILENEDVGDYDELVSFVDRIHGLGGQISIDDFGSGYSNLRHIVSIHTDYIKIDGSIIKKCCEDPESEHLIALITGWKNLGSRPISVVAEFVENEEIQNKLQTYDVDYSQGYYFSKPSPDIQELE